MKNFTVRQYYLATGMEGVPWDRSFANIKAESEQEACDIVAARLVPEDKPYTPSMTARDWVRGTLSAAECSK